MKKYRVANRNYNNKQLRMRFYRNEMVYELNKDFEVLLYERPSSFVPFNLRNMNKTICFFITNIIMTKKINLMAHCAAHRNH